MNPDFSDLTYAPYFNTYLAKLKSRDVLTALNDSEQRFVNLLSNMSETQWSYAYAENKWTLAQVVQHVIETEIIFGFRALTFSRESTPIDLMGFDENSYAASGNAQFLTGAELIAYFKSVRTTTRMLYKTSNKDQLIKIGKASNNLIQVEALFLVTAAHTLHHVEIIEQRYL